MAGLLADISSLNRLGDRTLAEPFGGGAGAALALLLREEFPGIVINDADSAIYDFWWSLLNDSDSFLEKLQRTRVTMAEWWRQRDIYQSRSSPSRTDRGFATFFLNRCNRSGIVINGGPIGGHKQEGPWKLNARYNKDMLRQRCEKIIEYRDRIRILGEDGVALIQDFTDSFLFIDPPYFVKGQTLYLNNLKEEYHQRLASTLQSLEGQAWVLTYDDCEPIRRMYADWAQIHPFALRYSAAERRRGRELLITPKWMQLPRGQTSRAINW